MGGEKIVFLIKASNTWGYGHLYRTIRLAKLLAEKYDIQIVTNEDRISGEMAEKNRIPLAFMNDCEFSEWLEGRYVRTLVIDRLNNKRTFLQKIKKKVKSLVLLDEQGEGAELADVLINSLVEKPHVAPINFYYGIEYMVFNEELENVAAKPQKNDTAIQKVLLAFGGSDPNNISELMIPVVIKNAEVNFTIVIGPGYQQFDTFYEKYKAITNLKILHNVPSLAELIYNSDLCIVSGGITLYECMYLKKKIVVACQVEHQVWSALKYTSKAKIFNLGIINDRNRRKLEIINQFLISGRIPFENTEVLDIFNGTQKVLKIIEEIGNE